MEEPLFYYSLINDTCSCRDANENLTKTGRRYKEYYEYLKKGMKGNEALNEMSIYRSCCRIKFLSLPAEPMIDRSSYRVIDHTVFPNTVLDTRELLPKIKPPEFPTL